MNGPTKRDRLIDSAAILFHQNGMVATSLAERQLTGVFDANAPESFVRFLERAGGLEVVREGDKASSEAQVMSFLPSPLVLTPCLRALMPLCLPK